MGEPLEVSIGSNGDKHFITELRGKPISVAEFKREKYASMALAEALPEARRQGAQAVLLQKWLQYARANGCECSF